MAEHVWLGCEYDWICLNLRLYSGFWICLIQCLVRGHSTSQWVLIKRWSYWEPSQRFKIEHLEKEL